MRSTINRTLLCLLAVFSVSMGACGKSEAEATKSVAIHSGDAATRRAERIWVDNCQACHGEKGQGDGAAAANLNPRPRRMSDPQWQKQTTDAQLRRVIVRGGAAVGLSKSMPATPTLASDRAALDVLVKKIRAFRR